jgi:hypothetical protein
MRSATAKRLRAIAYETLGVNQDRYYEFIKMRYEKCPKNLRHKFFDQFQHATYATRSRVRYDRDIISDRKNDMEQTQIDQLNTVVTGLQALVTQLQDFIAANPVAAAVTATPAQLSISNESITLSDGSVISFSNGVWSTTGAVSTGASA